MLSRSRSRACVIALLLAFGIATSASSARATTIDPLLWQQLVEGSAFVGVVECDQAGGIVARYRVVETWKGAPKPGEQITIKTAVNMWGPRYPLALVGDRKVVTAFAGQAPSRVMSTSMGPRTPPTWMRQVPHHYVLPLFQGAADTTKAGQELYELGSKRTSLAALKKDVEAFIAQSEEKRALEILRALGAKYDVKIPAGGKGTHRDVVKAMLDGVKDMDAPGKGETARQKKYMVERVLEQGAPLTRALVAELSPSAVQRDDPPRDEDTEMSAPPSAAELDVARASVRAGTDHGDFYRGVALLLEHDPAVVVDWAVAWVDPKKERHDADAGYFMGSWIAAKMATDRAKHLERMAKDARDPWMRAAGAVYLAYEDEARARPLLTAMMTSDKAGDPGTWAALALARRGDRAALMRAIEVFALPTDDVSIFGAVHMELRARVIELLSNTAASIRRPTPIRERGDDGKSDGDAHKKALAFLKANPSAVGVDPWLHVLKQQRVD